MKRPSSNEFPSYYQPYINSIQGDSIVDILRKQTKAFSDKIGTLSEDQGNFSYADGKWTIKEVLHHIIDVERIMAYRALRISRGDTTPLVGFDQDKYVEDTPINALTLKALLDEFKTVREATIIQYQNTHEPALDFMGTASGNPISALALFFIIAGHELHHFKVIKERYLPLI